MLGTSTTYQLFVSDELLDLSIDAIARCSLHSRRYESIHTTTRFACDRILKHGLGGEDIHRFFSSCPLDGRHKIHVTVDRRWKNDFLAVCEVLNRATGQELKPIQRFAILVHFASRKENRAP